MDEIIVKAILAEYGPIGLLALVAFILLWPSIRDTRKENRKPDTCGAVPKLSEKLTDIQTKLAVLLDRTK